jgi:hypothetical protein
VQSDSCRLTTKFSDRTPAAAAARGRKALARKVMVRARAPALYESMDVHFIDPGSLQRLVGRHGRRAGDSPAVFLCPGTYQDF